MIDLSFPFKTVDKYKLAVSFRTIPLTARTKGHMVAARLNK
jgi:hypothetical protein